ncbi:hypothetical protein GCM10020295_80240 [Streptomyces cinereospinus]
MRPGTVGAAVTGVQAGLSRLAKGERSVDGKGRPGREAGHLGQGAAGAGRGRGLGGEAGGGQRGAMVVSPVRWLSGNTGPANDSFGPADRCRHTQRNRRGRHDVLARVTGCRLHPDCSAVGDVQHPESVLIRWTQARQVSGRVRSGTISGPPSWWCAPSGR